MFECEECSEELIITSNGVQTMKSFELDWMDQEDIDPDAKEIMRRFNGLENEATHLRDYVRDLCMFRRGSLPEAVQRAKAFLELSEKLVSVFDKEGSPA